MAKKPLPTPDELRQLLRYEPETGKLFWRERRREWFKTKNAFGTWNRKYPGQEAFTAFDSKGYLTGRINSRLYKAHRVIWAMCRNAWPLLEIDHINGVKVDNRLSNLRDISTSENARNRGANSNNTTGFKGVSFIRRHGKWRADIMLDRKPYYLGRFDTPEEAHGAYCEAANRLHGEYARVE